MKKKGGLLVAIGMGPARKGGPSSEPDADDRGGAADYDQDDYAPDEAEMSAAEAALGAQKAGDAEGFARAVCNLIDAHAARK